MDSKKYVVPEGMLKAAHDAICNLDSFTRSLPVALEAALGWLAEQLKELERFDFNPHDGEEGMEHAPDGDYVYYAAVRRMFLASEPEVPKEIETLMHRWGGKFDDAILEAFRCGQQSVVK